MDAGEARDHTGRGATAVVRMPPLRGWLGSARGCYRDGAPTELPLTDGSRNPMTEEIPP